eukprot:3171220-Prymnesium_polylepis.1
MRQLCMLYRRRCSRGTSAASSTSLNMTVSGTARQGPYEKLTKRGTSAHCAAGTARAVSIHAMNFAAQISPPGSKRR